MSFNTAWDYEYWMKSNGMFVGLNTPDALKSKESNHGLPPYSKRKSYLVDKYPACPKNWMESKGRLASYFVPVKEGSGMWLDFNKNFENDHHVAIAISVQGVNPLTGVACEDEHLEQYIDNCPKCDSAFKPNRYCEKCDMKYPKQNYLCTTGTPQGKLWLDGFRSVEGAVRQYILTAEKMRGVASNIIGKDRVFAIGVSFFLSKEKKKSLVILPVENLYGSSSVSGSFSSCSNSKKRSYSKRSKEKLYSLEVKEGPSLAVYNYASDDNSMFYERSIQEVQTKKLEVGAGATIDQNVYDDHEQLSFWREEPEAIICINYALEEEVAQIISQGSKNLEGHKEGFLQNIPVGN